MFPIVLLCKFEFLPTFWQMLYILKLSRFNGVLYRVQIDGLCLIFIRYLKQTQVEAKKK